jgi:hypothetical protein
MPRACRLPPLTSGFTSEPLSGFEPETYALRGLSGYRADLQRDTDRALTCTFAISDYLALSLTDSGSYVQRVYGDVSDQVLTFS